MKKVKLVENYSLNISSDNIEILNKPKLVEANGKQYEARAVLRQVPVHRVDHENKNGRIYPKKLDEKIIKEKVAEGTLSLSGHPEDDGHPDYICGVWHNYGLNDKGIGVADWYLTGEKGQNLLEAIQAGGKIGVSRVGFGEFEDDEKTIKWDTYELQRLGDAVIDPSQDVFAAMENIVNDVNNVNDIVLKNSQKDDIEENLEVKENNKNNHFLISTSTNKKIKENNLINEIQTIEDDEVVIMNKIYEANFKNQVSQTIREAMKNPNCREAIENLQNLDIPEDMKNVRDKVQDAISKIQENMENKIQTANQERAEKDEVIKNLEEKIKDLEEKFGKANKVVEELQKNDGESAKELKKQKELLEANIVKMSNDIKALVEDSDLRDSDIVIFESEIKKRDIDIDLFEKFLLEAEDRIEEYEKELIKLGYKFEEEDEDKKDDEDKKKDEEDGDEEKKDDEKEEKKEVSDELYKDSEKKKEDKEKDKKEESTEKDTVKKHIKEYFEAESKKTPALKTIEKEVLDSENIVEAVEKVQDFKEEVREELTEASDSLFPDYEEDYEFSI